MSEFNDMPTIEPGLYRHYKGNEYRVVGIGCHSEFHPHEYYVVYEPVVSKGKYPDFWIRPYEMFVETVELDGQTIPRFEKLSD